MRLALVNSIWDRDVKVPLYGCYTSGMKHYSRDTKWTWTDANIPPEQLAWLGRELAAAKDHAVVFCHQRLDPSAERHHLMKNAAAVRAVLEKSGKVRAVLTGHEHTGGQCVVEFAGIDPFEMESLEGFRLIFEN